MASSVEGSSLSWYPRLGELRRAIIGLKARRKEKVSWKAPLLIGNMAVHQCVVETKPCKWWKALVIYVMTSSGILLCQR